MPDGGANHFRETIEHLKRVAPQIKVRPHPPLPSEKGMIQKKLRNLASTVLHVPSSLNGGADGDGSAGGGAGLGLPGGLGVRGGGKSEPRNPNPKIFDS